LFQGQKEGIELDTQFSAQELVGTLPMTTVVLKRPGHVIAATPCFWHTFGTPVPAAYPARLPSGDLGTALLNLLSCEGNDTRFMTYDAPSGTVGIKWYPFTLADEPAIVACLVPQMGTGTNSTAISLVKEKSSDDGSLDPEATEVLLEQAVDTCRLERLPLSVALLRVPTVSGRPLRLVHPRLWASVARKIRGLCRMTDLLAVTDASDFLVILIGARLCQARAVMKRITGFLDEWAAVNPKLLHPQKRLVTCLPAQETVTAARILAALAFDQ
jgi:hypothetical protein